MTEIAASSPCTSPEALITRLIAILRAIMLAFIDATLPPGRHRSRLHGLIDAYCAELSAQLIAGLTTPPRQPRATPRRTRARRNAGTRPQSTNPDAPARSAPPTQRPAPPAAVAIPRRQNPTQAPIRAIPQSPIVTTPAPRNFQKPISLLYLATPILLRYRNNNTKSITPHRPHPP